MEPDKQVTKDATAIKIHPNSRYVIVVSASDTYIMFCRMTEDTDAV